MLWASVKRLLGIRLLLQKVEQTLNHNKARFGGQVKVSDQGSQRANRQLQNRRSQRYRTSLKEAIQ